MMGLLHDFAGNCCGNWEGDTVPDGFWLRDYDQPTSMTALQFLDKIGPQRFGVVWAAAVANPALAYSMARGLAAQEVLMEQSFPDLYALEQAGLLPAGTAVEVWQ